MREAEESQIHDRTGYKYFCFSNLFPYYPKIEPGREVNLLISTPDENLASRLSEALAARIRVEAETKIGAMKFRLRSFEGPFFLPELRTLEPLKVRSSTPIIVRIPKWRYGDYGIKSERPYTFWRDTIALEAFVKQLRDNMEKKIIQYRTPEAELGYRAPNLTGEPSSEEKVLPPLPEVVSYRFVKTVSKPITVKGEKQLVIGSIWELEFAPQNEAESANLELAVESGFGERNSLGFGFMNLA